MIPQITRLRVTRERSVKKDGGARRKILQCNGIATSRDVKDKKFQEKM